MLYRDWIEALTVANIDHATGLSVRAGLATLFNLPVTDPLVAQANTIAIGLWIAAILLFFANFDSEKSCLLVNDCHRTRGHPADGAAGRRFATTRSWCCHSRRHAGDCRRCICRWNVAPLPNRAACRAGFCRHFEPDGPNGTSVCVADASDLFGSGRRARDCTLRVVSSEGTFLVQAGVCYLPLADIR